MGADIHGTIVLISDAEHEDGGHDEEVEGEGLDLSDARPDELPDKDKLQDHAEELKPDGPPDEAVVVRAVTNSIQVSSVNSSDGWKSDLGEASIVAVRLELWTDGDMRISGCRTFACRIW